MRALLIAVVFLTTATAVRAVEVESVTLAGRVVDSRMIVHRKVRSALFYLRLKVEVEKVESGHDLLRGARTIEVRCWQEIDGNGQYREGHRSIPADGAAFSTVLVAHPEGFFEPAGEAAIVLADTATARTFPILTKAPSTTGVLIGGVVGVLVLVVAGWMRYRNRGPRDRSWSAVDPVNED